MIALLICIIFYFLFNKYKILKNRKIEYQLSDDNEIQKLDNHNSP